MSRRSHRTDSLQPVSVSRSASIGDVLVNDNDNDNAFLRIAIPPKFSLSAMIGTETTASNA